MSKIFKALVVPTVLSIAGFTAGIAPAMAAGGIRAAYVEEVIPSRTYASGVELDNIGILLPLKPAAGVLGISSVTVTNGDATIARVILSAITTTGPNCTGSLSDRKIVYQVMQVQPQTSQHLTFPTPIPFVLPDASGTTCVGVSRDAAPPFATGFVYVFVTGVVN